MNFIKNNWRTLLFSIIGGIVGIVFIEMLRGDVSLATAMVAFGTLILAVVTAMAIDSSRTMAKRDRKERLLNEIIEWAKEIREISSASIDPSKIEFDSPLEQIAIQRDFLYYHRKYQEVNNNSAYMEEVASKVFGDKLLSIVRDVSQKLNDTIELLANCLTKKESENSKKVEKCKEAIDSCAEKLMVETTKLKTQDIS